MVQLVCAVFDQAAGVFGRPIFVAALGLASRSFADEVNRVGDGNSMNAHPQDFSLFHLGSFDDESGRLVSLEAPRRLSTASEVMLKPSI